MSRPAPIPTDASGRQTYYARHGLRLPIAYDLDRDHSQAELEDLLPFEFFPHLQASPRYLPDLLHFSTETPRPIIACADGDGVVVRKRHRGLCRRSAAGSQRNGGAGDGIRRGYSPGPSTTSPLPIINWVSTRPPRPQLRQASMVAPITVARGTPSSAGKIRAGNTTM